MHFPRFIKRLRALDVQYVALYPLAIFLLVTYRRKRERSMPETCYIKRVLISSDSRAAFVGI